MALVLAGSGDDDDYNDCYLMKIKPAMFRSLALLEPPHHQGCAYVLWGLGHCKFGAFGQGWILLWDFYFIS